jgi:hypothetical protein
MAAEMMNVALPYQEIASCKKDLNFWRIFQIEEYLIFLLTDFTELILPIFRHTSEKDLSPKICHSLGKLIDLNQTDRHLLGEGKKMTLGKINSLI